MIAVSAPVLAELDTAIAAEAAKIEDKVIGWRRDIHEHPELSNREFRTAKLVARHLRKLGFKVQTEVGHTGVVAVLEGGRPGGVVALRADMDGLPVVEKTGLPYASKVTSVYEGNEVGVMHACGHDNHVAILMGAAEVLVTDGGRSAAHAGAKGIVTAVPPQVLVTRVTGAGDTFMAAHIAAEARGEATEAALETALAVAAAFVSGDVPS